MDHKEKRLQERFSLQIQAKLSADADAKGNKVTEEIIATNISSGGAFLTTSRQLMLASKVHLEFLVSLEQLRKLKFILSLESLKSYTGQKIWVKASGIVIRIEKNGVGIIFDEDYQLSPMAGLAE